ncbi:MAG TPA: mechanosensitive ion channel domain-containing protein [Tepidisphaeraceae bacterium]|jgi:small-conductance mechanosensitive channel
MIPLIAWIGFTSDGHVEIFGTKLIGVDAENGRRLLLTIGYIAAVMILSFVLRGILRLLLHNWRGKRIAFWVRQIIRLLTTIIILIGIISIWCGNSGNAGTFFGLFSAGLAFALQRVITAFAGYVVILRGKTFNVGDRITMGGVRGDVVALGFIQTTIMEMGQAHGEQNDDPSMWVHSRQYTGRIVTVTNDKVFDTPVYNFTREFPYIWEEIRIPISYKDDWHNAERIILEAAKELTVKIKDLAEDDKEELERRYVLSVDQLEPRVYWRLTDNWIEMSLRFIVKDHGMRSIKDAMARRIITEFKSAKIGIASGTYDIVGLPPIQVTLGDQPPKKPS